MQMFAIPSFFRSDDDTFVLKQILKHYFDGTLPSVLTAQREHIEIWEGDQYGHKDDETRVRHSCSQANRTTAITD